MCIFCTLCCAYGGHCPCRVNNRVHHDCISDTAALQNHEAMAGGLLASADCIKFAICYCVAQLMTVAFFIASMYRHDNPICLTCLRVRVALFSISPVLSHRLMTYRVNFYDVDVSKIISIRKLWDIVLLNPADYTLHSLNATTHENSKDLSESRLIEMYMKSHNNRVHMYSV